MSMAEMVVQMEWHFGALQSLLRDTEFVPIRSRAGGAPSTISHFWPAFAACPAQSADWQCQCPLVCCPFLTDCFPERQHISRQSLNVATGAVATALLQSWLSRHKRHNQIIKFNFHSPRCGSRLCYHSLSHCVPGVGPPTFVGIYIAECVFRNTHWRKLKFNLNLIT